MTREEAIEIIKHNYPKKAKMVNYRLQGGFDDHDCKLGQALDMAIKALEQEPCEDAISRQAAINSIWDGINMDVYTREVKEDLEALPSVTPQPKTGHWIIEVWNNKAHHTCSNCQHVVTYEPCYHYCPYCGAEMKGVNDHE